MSPSLSTLLFLCVVICLPFHSPAQDVIVLKGGTLIDVEAYGKSENDVKDCTVIIENGKIKAVGAKVLVPKGAKVIDVSGKFIVPGLIDCFATVNNQSQANAFLYMGVTTVVALDDGDGRRGKVDWTVNPTPAKYRFHGYWGRQLKSIDPEDGRKGFVKTTPWNENKINRDIDSLGKAGVKVLLVHYGVEEDQLPAIVSACRKNGIVTIGELGQSSYKAAVEAGLQSFVHTSRYSADLLPDSVRTAYGTAPFGEPARYFYQFVFEHPEVVNGKKFDELAQLYKNNKVGLIPTASMLVYPEMDFARNPWKEPIAAILDERDSPHEPLDKETGRRKVPSVMRSNAAPTKFAIDKEFARNGAHFLTGSGTDAFGTLPGISMHSEMEMLSRFGLTNRQTLAAATNNFSLLYNWTHIGKIEAGREADILVLTDNPLVALENLKKIDVIIVDGKFIDRSKLLSNGQTK